MAKKVKIPDPPKLSEINNALRPRRIDITPEDIKNGDPLDPTSCAAAQCILRQPGVQAVRVHRGITLVQEKGKWTRYITSASMRMETIVFDRGGMFIAGEYDLQPVPLNYGEKPKRKRKPANLPVPANRVPEPRRQIPGVRVSARHRCKDGDE